MKSIYTFGRKPGTRNFTVKDLQDLKGSGKRLTMCNPANEVEIRACVDAGIDTLTVWDRDIDLARELAPTHFIGTAMGWGQFITHDEILRHAMGQMEAGADMYFTNRSQPVVEMLAREGIPVQVHMGLVPTFSHWRGGLKAYGRTHEEAIELYRTFKSYEDAGAFACEIECVAEETLNLLNERTSIVTISLGSGNAGDVIFLFMADICGEDDNPPRHAHAFRDLGKMHREMYAERVAALTEFKSQVHDKVFPYPAQSIAMRDGELEKFKEALGKL
ncbi:hydroxymethyltransferase (plasmid) [Phaeobacter inhibens]|uniref:3-methyl-2-oxobutanoate hydroxymethyltransferase n=1 Tax=Phaeobacter inhibens TaxID=221822 RepID=UPI00097187A2|nr:3-methyl-2-oxobutanoate hydroxymethyltransferase [Phaeobacter inhibens]APX18128.1 hydroxymethyltransferase [Phaeobacter inhibens]